MPPEPEVSDTAVPDKRLPVVATIDPAAAVIIFNWSALAILLVAKTDPLTLLFITVILPLALLI